MRKAVSSAEEWKERAFVLRVGHFREADVWMRVLFERHGVCGVFAFGGAKSRRRFCGCLDMLNTIDCRVHAARGGEYLNLREASLVAAPRRLRSDWRALGMAANCLRFAEAAGVTPESAADGFALLEDARLALERDGARLPMLPLFFRLRLATALGQGPDFGICGQCGANVHAGALFYADEGRIFCERCARAAVLPGISRALPLSADALRILGAAGRELPSQWDFAWASAGALRQGAAAIDAFVRFHLGLEWENGSFHRV